MKEEIKNLGKQLQTLRQKPKTEIDDKESKSSLVVCLFNPNEKRFYLGCICVKFFLLNPIKNVKIFVILGVFRSYLTLFKIYHKLIFLCKFYKRYFF